MVVLLDTSALEPAERLPAVQEAMRSTTATCDVRYEDDPHQVFTRIAAWQVGAVQAWRNQASGMAMIRTPKHVAAGFEDRVAIAIQERGTSRITYGDESRTVVFRPGDLICVDLSKPYNYAWSEKGSAFCISVQGDALAMAQEDVLAACSRLRASPVYDLFANHISGLARDVDVIPAETAAEAVGSATSDLLRALLNSVASDEGVARAGYQETQFARVRAYIEQNVRRPTLDPASIAQATSMSVRQLYRVCAANDYSVEQNIATLRLHGAQRQLREPGNAGLTIAAIARLWGFSDPAHFTRRFTREFGLSPRDWRALAGSSAPVPARD